MKGQNNRSSLFLKGDHICTTSLRNRMQRKNFTSCSPKQGSFIFKTS